MPDDQQLPEAPRPEDAGPARDLPDVSKPERRGTRLPHRATPPPPGAPPQDRSG